MNKSKTKIVTESLLDNRLKRETEKRGGWYIKLDTWRGIPDRMILLPKGVILFRELKTYGKKLTPLQESRIRVLIKLGFNASGITNEKEYLQTIDTMDLL